MLQKLGELVYGAKKFLALGFGRPKVTYLEVESEWLKADEQVRSQSKRERTGRSDGWVKRHEEDLRVVAVAGLQKRLAAAKALEHVGITDEGQRRKVLEIVAGQAHRATDRVAHGYEPMDDVAARKIEAVNEVLGPAKANKFKYAFEDAHDRIGPHLALAVARSLGFKG